MLRNVVILFIVIYPLYVLFTRQPDFFDGEMYRATIHHVYDFAHQKQNTFAVYSIEHHTYTVPANYPFRYYKEGETLPIIYEASSPEKASLYCIWGYWIRWKELLSFIAMFLVFYFLAINITSNPTPESLLEELEDRQQKPRKRRYDN